MHPELDPATYGLTIWDLDREFLTGGLAGATKMPLGDILTSCATPTAAPSASSTCTSRTRGEALDPEQVEGVSRCSTRRAAPHPRPPQRRRGLREVPRHQVRGPEALRHRGRRERHPDPRRRARGRRRRPGPRRAVMGMAHRGRLNVLTNIVGKSYDQLFSEFEGNIDPDSTQGSGDVKYHLGQTGKFTSAAAATRSRGRAGRQPVAPRGRRPGRGGHGPGPHGPDRAAHGYPVLPILIHGDAAFAGQGVVAETLNLSRSRATGSAARSTSSSTTSSASPPRRSRPAPRSTPPTSPRWSRRRSST
jgi:multifunctional 2-oxoglutarate metabolism enzyme